MDEAVKNNPDKFPEKYCFTLQLAEKQFAVTICDRKKELNKVRVLPKAFTERGLYMLATVLKSPWTTATILRSKISTLKIKWHKTTNQRHCA